MRTPGRDRSSARRGVSAYPDMTPMIDVVFLLVIFFLVSSHFARRETRLRLDLPTAGTAQPDEDPSPRLTIHIDAAGALRLGSEGVTPRGLIQRLKAVQQGAAEPPRVRVRGDRAAPYAAVEPALAACAEAGVTDVALAVYSPGAGR